MFQNAQRLIYSPLATNLMEEEIINIENREEDYKNIRKQVWDSEAGIRAICVMYDEHSSDKNSKKKIFLLKDNIQYRLFGAVHQYLVFLRELGIAENHLHKLHIEKPEEFNAYPIGNPHFEQIELQLSSIFDSIVFQLSSVFDYLSHMTCYICKTNKSKTLYWTKLAKLSRGTNNDFGGEIIRNVIDLADRNFVGRLYDYRSRLLHSERDLHEFMTTVGFSDEKVFDFEIKILFLN